MSERAGIDRRQFLKTSAAGIVGAGLPGPSRRPLARLSASQEALKIKDYRVLGRTGFKVSDIGFGGADLMEPGLLEAASTPRTPSRDAPSSAWSVCRRNTSTTSKSTWYPPSNNSSMKDFMPPSRS